MITVGQHLKHGVYGCSPVDSLEQFRSAISGKKFLDIGSGRGDIVEKALQLGANAFGIEVEDELYNSSKCKDRIIFGDVFDLDLIEYDVLYYYIGGCWKERELMYKIMRTFKGYLILYSG